MAYTKKWRKRREVALSAITVYRGGLLWWFAVRPKYMLADGTVAVPETLQIVCVTYCTLRVRGHVGCVSCVALRISGRYT